MCMDGLNNVSTIRCGTYKNKEEDCTMGVQGLLSCCLHKKNEAAETVDLVEVARTNGGIELMVDFYSFEHMIVQKFWKGLSHLHQNQYLRILGGEYFTFGNYLKKFVQDLMKLNIRLVFFVDCSKGCSSEATRNKLDTWITRHQNDTGKLNEIMDVLRGTTQMGDLSDTTSVRPVCLEIQVFHTLKQCGCEIIQSVAEEADFSIAKALCERQKAYAVLSNDSDFCIFKNSWFIPYALFDIENNIQLGQAIDIPIKPEKLLCGIITPQRVMNILGFRSYHLLVELSIVAGNDFTGPILKSGLQQQLDVRGRQSIENFAGWVRHYKSIENHPILAREMSYNQPFANAVHHSRNFYNLTQTPDQPPKKGFLSKLLMEGIQQGKYSVSLMSMHNNFYWHRMLLEDTSEGQPCAEVALAELRAHIYRIVLPHHESLVNEYGRSPWEPLRSAGVMAVEDPNIPPIHKIQENKIFQNLRNFHHIMTHQEQDSQMWFDRYGRKNGFIVYCLRYFLLLNWHRNLHISEQEFLALVAMAFGRPKEANYQHIQLKPTPRCVTIGNWWQDLYRHAYLFLGKVLFLSHEFPLPHEIFCGSAWTAFYMSCKDDTFYASLNQVSMDTLRWTQEEMNRVISEKKHMIKYFVEGVFHFETNF